MSELILHHYAMSPFAEKARLMLGFKGLSWRSVDIPAVMPKPDVVALTGGYRRTPLLQVGADIYCDTALIARVLEARQPQPRLFPGAAPLARPLAQWADTVLFWCAVTWAMQPAGAAAILGAQGTPDAMKAFAVDRAAFIGTMRRMTLADATAQLKVHLAALDTQLAQSGPFLLGELRCVADFAVAHCLWFIRQATSLPDILAPHAALCSWLDRMLAIGHGTSQAMDSAEAVKVARAAGGHVHVQVTPGMGFDAGQTVNVTATDYGIDPVVGNLVGLDADEVVVSRNDPRAGTVHVHFPRAGFQVKKETS